MLLNLLSQMLDMVDKASLEGQLSGTLGDTSHYNHKKAFI
jgi:hypothetical protein